jgi:hypothetical protein
VGVSVSSCVGASGGASVGVAVAVGVSVGVPVAVGVGVREGVGVSVGVGDAVSVGRTIKGGWVGANGRNGSGGTMILRSNRTEHRQTKIVRPRKTTVMVLKVSLPVLLRDIWFSPFKAPQGCCVGNGSI